MRNVSSFGILIGSLMFAGPSVAQEEAKVAALQSMDIDTRISRAFEHEPIKLQAAPAILPTDRVEPRANATACSAVDSAKVSLLVRKIAAEEGVDPDLADAVAWVESQHGTARNASSSGAMGIMQLMPETASAMGVTDRCNVEANIRGGVKYLKKLYAEFGDPLLMLAAYNAGPGNVYKKQGIPEFEETTKYIVKVLNRWKLSAMVRPKHAALAASNQPENFTAKDGEGKSENVWEEGHVIEVQ
jgi:soluble lytic murein transglycosylase-like protein